MCCGIEVLRVDMLALFLILQGKQSITINGSYRSFVDAHYQVREASFYP